MLPATKRMPLSVQLPLAVINMQTWELCLATRCLNSFKKPKYPLWWIQRSRPKVNTPRPFAGREGMRGAGRKVLLIYSNAEVSAGQVNCRWWCLDLWEWLHFLVAFTVRHSQNSTLSKKNRGTKAARWEISDTNTQSRNMMKNKNFRELLMCESGLPETTKNIRTPVPLITTAVQGSW